MNALLASKACDVTGIIAIACGRHGCYAPNSLCDLFLGEQQKNIDFGVIMTILLTFVDPDQGLLLIYDIVCQYIVHFLERIGVHIPEGLTVEAAIGLFHVHAHKDDCFFRFASSFIPGAGVVAGEILESLWSSLNAISPSARTATLSHRAELLDDHATDSNHKKMLGMVSNLCRNYRKALDMFEHAEEYYNNLTNQAGPVVTAKWRDDVEKAEASRRTDLKAMDIYAARLERDKVRSATAVSANDAVMDKWMSLSLVVEDKQYADITFIHYMTNQPLFYRLKLKANVRHLRRSPGALDPMSIQSDREELSALFIQLNQIQREAGVAEPNSAVNAQSNPTDIWDDFAFDPIQEEAEPVPTTSSATARLPAEGPIPIEDVVIPLPSNGNTSLVYRDLEISHRTSAADEQLNHIRNLIAEKSFQFSHVIRVAPRKGVATRSRAAVKKLNNEIAEHCRMYSRCRISLMTLGADESLLSRFKVLSPSDIAASTIIINPNDPGSTRISLSWIWQSSARHILAFTGQNNEREMQADDHNSLLECM